MVFLDVYEHGVMLSRSTGEHRQSVCLDGVEWSRLVDVREAITDAIKAEREDAWRLRGDESSPTGLRATVSGFANQFFVHIRLYWKDKPTKQGVTMGLAEWLNFHTVLSHGKETKIAHETYTTLLKENIDACIKRRCEGCSTDSASQRDHDCVMMASGFVETIIEERVEVDVFEFVERATQAARAKGKIIQKPLEEYRLCETFRRGPIERAYLVSKM